MGGAELVLDLSVAGGGAGFDEAIGEEFGDVLGGEVGGVEFEVVHDLAGERRNWGWDFRLRFCGWRWESCRVSALIGLREFEGITQGGEDQTRAGDGAIRKWQGLPFYAMLGSLTSVEALRCKR